MTIYPYKKSDGKTYYMFKAYLGIDELTGKPIKTTRRGFSNKKDARTAYLRLLLEENQHKPVDKYNFKDIYEMWLEQYKLTVRESTLSKTLGLFRNHILPSFGKAQIEDIKVYHAQKAVNTWFKSHTNYRMTARYSARVIDYAIRNGMAEKNPFDLVEWPVRMLQVEDIEKEDLNYLDKDELEILLKASKELDNPLWHPFFRLLAFSGMRRGEALALTWKDIHFDENKISITKTLTLGLDNKQVVHPPKTLGSIRTLDMDYITMGVLKEWKKEQYEIYKALGYDTSGKTQLVFSNPQNNFLSFPMPGHRLNYLTEKTGITRIRPHGFRHTHCSLLFEAGAAIQDVQDRLGHSDIRTTMNIYNHVSKKKKTETVDKLMDYLDY